jgi:uncharacterized protein YgiM (DUF1202 family)
MTALRLLSLPARRCLLLAVTLLGLSGLVRAQAASAEATPTAASSASTPTLPTADPAPANSGGWLGGYSLFGGQVEARNGGVRVMDPFLEFHTGPGRGYPVFFVAERDEWVLIELRHTDWYKVRSAKGKLGWVSREQLLRTLTEAGEPPQLADTTIEGYLRRTVDFGAGYGAYHGNSIMRAWLGWRFADTLSAEMDVAQVQARLSSTNLWHVNLLSEPWSDQRLSPFFGIGMGRYHYNPNQSLVDNLKIDNQIGAATLGMRYHLTGRVAFRFDYTMYTAFVYDDRTKPYRAYTAGLSVHF